MRRALVVIALLAAPAGAQSIAFEGHRGLATAPGQWTYARNSQGSEARFGALLSIKCVSTARLLILSRADGNAPEALTIVTDSLERTIPPSGSLDARDALLDAIAFSRGRFMIARRGALPLAIPASPEAARTIEDCRN